MTVSCEGVSRQARRSALMVTPRLVIMSQLSATLAVFFFALPIYCSWYGGWWSYELYSSPLEKQIDVRPLFVGFDEENPMLINKKEEVISFKCELHENLQKAMKEFVEEHPNWDQYRILQVAIAGFLIQKGFQNRDLTRLYIGKMFSMNFED